MSRIRQYEFGSNGSDMVHNKKFSISVFIITLFLLLLLSGCSAFLVRHTDHKGATRTYVTDTVYVGTGTLLDCVVSPFHWMAGLFYFQPYIHVRGGNISYPTFGGSGCFNRGYSKGQGLLSAFSLNLPLFTTESAESQVIFTDINKKEIVLTGGSLEIIRATKRLNFSSK